VKLINQPFDGDKKKLKELIDNVSTAFELIRPDQRQLLLKSVKTKITREARSKLLVRDLTSTWGDVRRILEENYDIKRTLEFYACRMFSDRQGPNENIASWSSRIDTMQSELWEAAYRICSEEEMVGAMGLINHLAKACFVQGLSNERVQTIVGAKGETAMLSVCIDATFEKESAIPSAKERGFNVGNIFKGPGRGSGFIPRDINRGIGHPGRRVGYDNNRNISKSAHVVSDAARERVPAGNFGKNRCHACGALGHISRFCRKKDNGAWKNADSTGNWGRGQRSSRTGSLPGRY
jgi:hypothetical protein